MFSFPSAELQALFDLYDFTGGDNWKWYEPYSEYGIEWEYGNYSANPCTENWQGLICTSNCTISPCNVNEILLYSRNMMGSIPHSLSNLTHVQLLDLFDNHLTGKISVYCELPHLQTLIVGSNLFDSSIPACLGKLPQLNSLSLNSNRFTGTLPAELGHAVSTQSLYLENNPGIYGDIPLAWGNLTNLTAIDLSYCHLNSSIPVTIGNITKLVVLSLETNFMTGTIPTSMGRLTHVNMIALNTNYFYGTLPGEMFNSRNSPSIDISINFFSGLFPSAAIESLPGGRGLTRFNFGSNQFTGELWDVGQSPDLTYLSGYDNVLLGGTIPESIINCKSLVIIHLYNMSLTGSLPSALLNGSLPFFYYVDVSHNMLSQSLPAAIGSDISTLHIHDNSFTGHLPLVSKASSLSAFLAYNNQFSGALPFPDSFNPTTDCLYLSIFSVGYNQLTNAIPSSVFKLQVLYVLQVSGNYLTNTISTSIAQSSILQTVLLDSNLLTGSLPTRGLSMNGHLLYLNLSTNLLTGTLPVSLQRETQIGYLDLSNNAFTGSVGSIFQSMSSLEALILFNNKFTGSLVDVLGEHVNAKLLQVDFGSNAFTGTLPLNFFQQPALQLFVANINCFTGSLSAEICHARNMTTLILDGLHTSEHCNTLTKFFPWQQQSTYTLQDGLQGTVPRCIYALPQLETLHLAGNGLIDTLQQGDNSSSGLAVSNSLHDLSMSHNLLHGTIAMSLLQHRWSNLDLSFNQLDGTLPQDAPAWAFTTGLTGTTAAANGSLKLSINRLSGQVPVAWQTLPDIDMLSGNLFSCQADGQGLPVNDPNYQSYNCGSDLVNYSLIAWGSFFAVAVGVLVGCFFFGVSCCTSRQKSASLSSSTRTWRKQMSNDGHFLLLTRCRRWLAVFKGTDGQAASSFYGLPITNLIILGVTLRRFAIMVAAVLFALLFLFLPIYAIFTHYFGTYEHQYAWTVSFSFLQGQIPAIVLFVALILLLVYVQIANAALVVTTDKRPSLSSSLNPHDERRDEHDITEERTSPLRQPVQTSPASQAQQHQSLSTRAWFWFELSMLILINCILVLSVNGAYVFATQKSYNARVLGFISFLVSIFKLLWGNLVVIGWLGSYLRSYLHSNEANEDGWRLFILIAVTLFNNIAAPYAAEAFVSSNCFKYAVSSPPAVLSSFVAISCSVLSYNITSSGLSCAPGGPQLSVLPQFSTGGGTTISTVTFHPPFLYSEQCSSSLLTSFAYIFVYRYLLSGLLQPMGQLLVKWLQVQEVSQQDKSKAWRMIYLTAILPLLLRPIIRDDNSDEIRSASGIEVVGLDCSAEETHKLQDVVSDSLDPTHTKTASIIKNKDEIVTHGRTAFTVRLICDLAVLLTFGVLFPPLAFVIAVSIAVELMSTILLLGRLVCMASDAAKQQAGHREQQEELQLLIKCVNDDYQGFGQALQRSISLKIGFATCFWSFSLFDTLAAANDSNPVQAVWIAITMSTAPLWLWIMELSWKIAVCYSNKSNDKREGEAYRSLLSRNNNGEAEIEEQTSQPRLSSLLAEVKE